MTILVRAVASVLALFLLNVLFTFENVPSTPLIRLTPTIAREGIAVVWLLIAFSFSSRRTATAARVLLTLTLVAIIWLRYIDVTVLGVLGRPFDLYGDTPHVHRVAASFLETMTPMLGVGVIGVLMLIAAASFGLCWAVLRGTSRICDVAGARRWLAVGAAAALVLSFLVPGMFSQTTSRMLARQARSVMVGPRLDDVAGLEKTPAHMNSRLSALGNAHVIVIFVESYGVSLLEEPDQRRAILPRFVSMETRLRNAGYAIGSTQIVSPTFGGGSWRAHATLLTGFETSSERVYDALLQSNRPSLVQILARKGYRTIAAEPGIQRLWPEGLFYGFDKIYDFKALDYRGPAIGWWKVPDQYTLYRVFTEEILPARQPVFAKFSLIMTHIPYFPVPDYVSDWTRFDRGTAYERGLHSVAHDAYRDLLELSRWYVASIQYELDVLEGLLLNYVPDNSLVIVLGDHQPPKIATHDSHSWAVPMHVFSRRPELVRAFESLGFEPALVPNRGPSMRMSEFLDAFLRAFDAAAAPEASTGSPAPR
ncbi:MAG: sulfatase-like hydrolase/transferase [Vicinamibacterales bacterium]